jgi:hypothetical protein
MLSKYHRDVYSTSYETTPCDSASPKLIANLYDKTEYVVHITNPQLYINMGWILTRIHRVIRFRQSRRSKPYVDTCSELRSKSIDDFDKEDI